MHLILIMSFFLILLDSITASDSDQNNLINDYRFPPIPINHYEPVFSVIEEAYIFSGSLPPSYGFIRTAKDYKNILIYISNKENKFFSQQKIVPINNFIEKYSINEGISSDLLFNGSILILKTLSL